jgi:hypothetical protein
MRGVRSAGPSLTGEHWRPSDSNRSLSTSNQSLSPHAKSGGKKFGEARDRWGIFGDIGRFRATETVLAGASGGKATEN